MELKFLETMVKKDLEKRRGFIKATKGLLDIKKGIYFDTWVAEDGVVVFILNSHNSYLEEDLSKYRKVAKYLLDCGYNIKMNYPCYIGITEAVNRF